MTNVSTIGGAALWAAVVSALMLAALTPVSVTTQTGAPLRAVQAPVS